MPDDVPWPEQVVVPDDLRELQDDVEAYHRELRTAARRHRFARLTGTRAWQRLALPVGIVLGSLAVAASVLGILTLGQPRPSQGPAPAPLATAPIASAGAPNGLLPDATVQIDGRPVDVRSQRPALLALVPMHCGCTSLLASLANQADEVNVPLVVVAPAAQDAELDTLPGQLHRGDVVPAFDSGGRLAAAYSARGVTVLVVSPDATVSFMQYDVQPGVRLEGPLEQMVLSVGSLRAP